MILLLQMHVFGADGFYFFGPMCGFSVPIFVSSCHMIILFRKSRIDMKCLQYCDCQQIGT